MTVINSKLHLFCLILGCLTDYYIAVGVKYLGKKNFPERTYYWCSGDKW